MPRRGVKKRDFERLDDANIKRVIGLLEADQPITKKAACEVLNISYNTSRLANIINEYKERKEYETRRRKENRSKPISVADKQFIASSYLTGQSIKWISDKLFRSTDRVKRVIEELNLPKSSSKGDYWHPEAIPDENLKEDYKVGEMAWSARYNCVCEIRELVQESPEHGKIYRIWIHGKHNQSGVQPWYELGSLDTVMNLGINASELKSDVGLDLNLRIE